MRVEVDKQRHGVFRVSPHKEMGRIRVEPQCDLTNSARVTGYVALKNCPERKNRPRCCTFKSEAAMKTDREWADYWEAETYDQHRKHGWTLFFLAFSVAINIL